jgi:hypothetical protein
MFDQRIRHCALTGKAPQDSTPVLQTELQILAVDQTPPCMNFHGVMKLAFKQE